MKVEVKKQPKSTVGLNIVVPNSKVKEEYEKIFAEVVKNAEIKGFRKGQAPADMVKEKTDVSKLYGDIINNLLQTYYPQALKENHIQSVANPKVEIKEFDLDKDFEFNATVPVKPEITLGDYKKKLKENYEKKKKDLKSLNAEKLKKGEPLTQDHIHLKADDVITALVETTKVDIADLIIEDETDRMMSRLVDQAQSVGLSLEQYLKAHNKTAEELRKDYAKIAEKNVQAEFILSKLVEEQNVQVTDEEVTEMAKASGDENTLKDFEHPAQRMYVKSILAKNKVITELIKEIEGDDYHAEHAEHGESNNQ